MASEKMNPDSESVYDSEIAPLMVQILEICTKHRIPMLATFQYGVEGDDDLFVTSRRSFDGEAARLQRACDIIYPRIRT